MKSHITSTIKAAKYILRGFQLAHNAIIEGKTDINAFEAGTTTMIGGIVLDCISDIKRTSCVFVLASVGDCKAYHWSKKQTKLIDVTAGNRMNINDIKDPGGRLGPQIPPKEPDLRNLSLYSVVCEEGDLILLMSDGIHDNLDPPYCGKVPQDFGITGTDWESCKDEKAAQIRANFALEQLNSKICEDSTPIAIVNKLIDYVLQNTFNIRNWMESQDRPQPKDSRLFPGKMDHATAVCIKISNLSYLVTTSKRHFSEDLSASASVPNQSAEKQMNLRISF